MFWTVWYTHSDSTSHTLRLNRRAHLCWPLQWGSRRPWWRQLWPSLCPPPAWCAGATRSSGLLRGQRWGFWEAPSAIPSASGAGCSPAASRRTNADTATCNAGFVSDVWALVNTHQSVGSYFQVTYIKKQIICSKLKRKKKIQFSSSTVCLMYFPFKLLLAFYYYTRNNCFPM